MIFNVYLDYYYTILLLRLYSHNITTQIPPSIKVEVIEWREAGGMHWVQDILSNIPLKSRPAALRRRHCGDFFPVSNQR